MRYMKEKLGAWQISGDDAGGEVQFKLFFPRGWDPRIASIQVAGDFQSRLQPAGVNWDFDGGLPLTRDDTHSEGTLWSCRTGPLPAGFYQYKYLVTFDEGSRRKVSDPCTRYGGSDHQNAAVVVGGSKPGAKPIAPLRGGRKPLRDLVIYEMMIDDFTDEYRGARAPLDAIRDKLEYLGELGFTAILLMPWTAWRSSEFDWGYAPYHYFSVEYRYANDLNRPEEKLSYLEELVSACHERGIHVIMDGVFNHGSMDFPYKRLYLNEDDCPYTGDFGGTFYGLQDLDFNNRCTQEFIRDVCLYWHDTFNIDGIRFDNTVNYNLPGKVEGLPKLLADIRAHMAAKGERNFSLTLEHIDLSAAAVTNQTEATSYWDDGLFRQCSAHLRSGEIHPAAFAVLNNQRFLHAPEKVPTVYLGNHDHSHVNWRAGAADDAGAFRWWKTQPWAIALLTGPGTPLIQNGQEFGEDHWIPENDEGTGRRVEARPLHWKRRYDLIGKALLALYSRLIRIRNEHPALRSTNFHPPLWEDWMRKPDADGYGLDADAQVMIFHRWGNGAGGELQRFVVVINFSNEPRRVTVPFPENGTWTDLLSGFAGTWKPTVHGYRLSLEVGSCWGHIFFR